MTEALLEQVINGLMTGSIYVLVALGMVLIYGVMHVVKAGPKYELVARNELGEKTYASPALSDGQIFLRGIKNLYCIGKAAK